jgi:hypothetical protein
LQRGAKVAGLVDDTSLFTAPQVSQEPKVLTTKRLTQLIKNAMIAGLIVLK